MSSFGGSIKENNMQVILEMFGFQKIIEFYSVEPVIEIYLERDLRMREMVDYHVAGTPTDITIKRSFDSIEIVISNEHWITDSIINENIPIIQIGFMEIDDIFVELKKNYQPDDVLEKMKSINEAESIWIVKGEDIKERQWDLDLNALRKIRQQ